jgi:uncharacterized protein YigE (DUF2233 family)
MYRPVSQALHFLIIAVLIGAFGSLAYFVSTEPGGVTDVLAFMSTPAASPTPTDIAPEPGWDLIQPGLEKRAFPIYNELNKSVETLHIWRLNQKYFRLDVAYNATPKTLETWQREKDALMVVNGGFYSVENKRYFPDGLAIVNGQATGRSFSGYGGMLAINESGSELRWLVEKPYDSSERLQAALQSFPMLVLPGGELGFGVEKENNKGARRTVIAQDKYGRILFMIAPQGYFTLHRLSVYLTESSLNLETALNLDGGGSTGILVANPREVISSDRPLPFVILVYPK